MIEIVFIMKSETKVEGFAVRDRDGNTLLPKNGEFRKEDFEPRLLRSFTFDNDSAIGSEILKGLLNGDLNTISTALENIDSSLAEFFADIKVSSVTGNNVRAYGNMSKSGKTVKDPYRKRSYVKPSTLPLRYKINGLVNKLPYKNYENNDSGEVNCVLHYFREKHKTSKLCQKELTTTFKDGADLGTLIDYVTKKKLKTTLVNLNGNILFKSDYETSRGRKRVYAIITDNHFYPLKKGYSKFTPQLIEKEIETKNSEVLAPVDQICISKNNTIYTPDGVIKSFEFENDKKFMDNMQINYTHEGDVYTISTLLFKNKRIENMKYEYDLKSAYTNVATDWADSEKIGIFSCFDIWQPFTGNSILGTSHYAISKKALKSITSFGVRDNVMDGYQIKVLMDADLFEYDDIKYIKTPSESIQFSEYRTKFANLKLKLTHGLTIGTPEYKEKLDQIRIYIGILGCYKKHITTTIRGCGNDEHELLNFNKDVEEWKVNRYCFNEDDEDEVTLSSYAKQRQSVNTINACHIRNYIVGLTNRILLRNIISVFKKKNKMPCKIVTDCIGYEKEVPLLDDDRWKFKVQINPGTKLTNKQGLTVKNAPLKTEYTSISRKFHDIASISEKILQNASDNIKDTITYTGAPGTGKTYAVKHGDFKYDICATITNMCKRNMGEDAQTMYSLLLQHEHSRNRLYNIYNRLKNKKLWIDEFSMIPALYWNIIFDSCAYYGTKLCLSGDINQIGPIHGKKIDILNPMVKIFLGDVTTLTIDRRNDSGIIELRDSVLNKVKLPDVSTESYLTCPTHLVYTNIMKGYINLQILKERNQTFEYKNGSITCSVGCKVKSRANLHDHKIFKNEIYTVLEDKEKTWVLKNNYYDHTIEISNKLMNNFELGYANTYHSTQGLTFNEPYCLHQIGKAYSRDVSILYTGITRGTKLNNLKLYDDDHQCSGCKECTYKLPTIYTF